MPVRGACRLCYHAKSKHNFVVHPKIYCRVPSCGCDDYVGPRSARWKEMRRERAAEWLRRELADKAGGPPPASIDAEAPESPVSPP